MSRARFRCYFFFVGWDCLSLGLHVSVWCPNVEIHLPFGFVRVGWESVAHVCVKGIKEVQQMGDIDGAIKREVRKAVIKAMVVVCSIAALGSAITWWLMR
jgi:hypothetical protein